MDSQKISTEKMEFEEFAFNELLLNCKFHDLN